MDSLRTNVRAGFDGGRIDCRSANAQGRRKRSEAVCKSKAQHTPQGPDGTQCWLDSVSGYVNPSTFPFHGCRNDSCRSASGSQEIAWNSFPGTNGQIQFGGIAGHLFRQSAATLYQFGLSRISGLCLYCGRRPGNRLFAREVVARLTYPAHLRLSTLSGT